MSSSIQSFLLLVVCTVIVFHRCDGSRASESLRNLQLPLPPAPPPRVRQIFLQNPFCYCCCCCDTVVTRCRCCGQCFWCILPSIENADTMIRWQTCVVLFAHLCLYCYCVLPKSRIHFFCSLFDDERIELGWTHCSCCTHLCQRGPKETLELVR